MSAILQIFLPKLEAGNKVLNQRKILSKSTLKFNLLDVDRPFALDLKNVRKVWDLLYITCPN